MGLVCYVVAVRALVGGVALAGVVAGNGIAGADKPALSGDRIAVIGKSLIRRVFKRCPKMVPRRATKSIGIDDRQRIGRHDRDVCRSESCG